MGKVKELESEIPEFNSDTHRWDWKLKKVVELTPEELAEIARRKRKADLEERFKILMQNPQYYRKVFPFECVGSCAEKRLKFVPRRYSCSSAGSNVRELFWPKTYVAMV